MPRARTGVAHLRRRNRVMKRAKGYVQGHRKLYRQVKEAIVRSGVYAYRDRRNRKRDMRRLWITRLNAACRERGLRYSEFIHGLKNANVILDRRLLSELAIDDPATFDAIITLARNSLKAAA